MWGSGQFMRRVLARKHTESVILGAENRVAGWEMGGWRTFVLSKFAMIRHISGPAYL